MKKIFSLFAAVIMAVSVMAETAELTQFSTTSGTLDENISYASYKGGGTSDPQISSKQIRLYQRASQTSVNTIGGYITITAASGYKISSVSWKNGIAGTYTYSVDQVLTNGTTDFPFDDLNATNGGTSTISDLDCTSITLYARGTASGNRLYLASLSVTYAATSSDPKIVASNVTIDADATSGEIAYSITNPAAGVNPTVAITSGNWISNAQVDVVNSKITFDAEENTSHDDREATLTISYTGATDKVVTVTQKKSELTEIVDVTGAMTWDFSGYTTDVMPEDKAVEVILGNYITLKTGDANALKGKQQYIVRNNYCWQGTDLIFHPTVAGVVEVNWSSTSGSNYRTLKINDGDYAVPGGSNSTSAAGGVTTTAFVPANQDVVLTGWDYKNSAYTSNQIRIWSMSFTPADQVNVSAEAGYATYFNADNAVELPTGVTGYVWDNNALVEVYDAARADNKVIPAGEPVVLKAAAGTYSLKYTTTKTQSYKEIGSNDLQGAATAMTAAEMAEANPGMGKFYALSLNAEGKEVGFYWINEGGAAFDITAGKAYLALPAGPGAPARFIFGQQGVPTEVVNVNDNNQSTKVLRDGRLYIFRDGNLFDLNGRLVK